MIEVVNLTDEPSMFAEVIAVGNGGRVKDGTRRAPEVNVGDRIVTKPFVGTPYKDFFFITEDDALAVVEGL